MNFSKAVASTLLVLYFSLYVTGCAMFMHQLTNEDGEPMFQNKTTGAMIAQSELDKLPPAEQDKYQAYYDGKPGPVLSLGASIISMLGPWGAMAGAAISGVIPGVVAGIVNKKKFNAEAAKNEVVTDSLAVAVGIIQDLRDGKVDRDHDGKIEPDEIMEYAKEKVKGAMSPEFFNEIVRIVQSTLPVEKKAERMAEVKV